jgi:hypothetical protein
MDDATEFNSLNDSIHIFLTFRNAATPECVANLLSQRSQQIEKLELIDITKETEMKVTENMRFLTRLKRLDIVLLQDLSKQFLDNVFNNISLRALSIHCCTKADSWLERISECKNLEEIYLNSNYIVSLKEFNSIAQLSELKKLTLRLSPRISPEEFLKTLSTYKISKVTYLNLTIQSVTYIHLESLAANCPNLEQLKIVGSFSQIDKESKISVSRSIIQSCKKLKKINLVDRGY